MVDALTTGQHTRVGNVFMYAPEQQSNNFKLEDASTWLRQGENVGKHDKLGFCIPASPAKATHILQPYLQMGVGIRNTNEKIFLISTDVGIGRPLEY